jgi:hypothetical protein
MKFKDFLDKYYLTTSAKEVTTILTKLKIYGQVSQTIDEFYIESPTKDVQSFDLQLILTISDFVSTINTALSLVNKIETKAKYQNKLTELGIFLIKETYKISNYSKKKYFKILRTTLQKVYKKHNWNFDELNNLLRLDIIEKIESENLVSKTNNSIKSTSTFLEWNEDAPHIDLFLSHLKSYFKINKLSSLRLLFQPVIKDFEIEISKKHLKGFLVLFEQLHLTKTIKIKTSRGLFTYLQSHLISKENDLPLQDFRKYKFDFKKKNVSYKAFEESINKEFEKHYLKRTIGR